MLPLCCPMSDEMMTLASTGIFVLHYPDHRLTSLYKDVAAQVWPRRRRPKPMSTGSIISREEVLSGLSGRAARQASALLVLIEAQTAYLVVQARLAMAPYLTEQATTERNHAFLEALALGREPPVPPTIQDSSAGRCTGDSLVPDNPNLRAMVAHRLGQKYSFIRPAIPRVQAVLGLDTPAVQEAYRRLYSVPLASIYADRLQPVEQLRWRWARLGRWLDELPPFWTAFALTLTNTVGASILALPIAVAQIGPLAGVAILVLLGLVNVVTIAWIAESLTRTSSIRYGKTYLNRVVSDYLGGTSARVLSIATFVYCVLALVAYYIGFGTSLAGATSIPAWLWVGLLFAVNVYFVQRRSLNATVLSALVIGALNIGLILVMSFVAISRAQPANWSYVAIPGLNGQPFDPAVLQLTFGVALGVYAGHLSVSNCAQVVLRRDPSGRALLHGATAALLAAIALFCLWVVAVNGAITPSVLARETGTALVPLAALLGTPIRVVGTIYVVLGIGMISIHASLGLYNLCREWLFKRNAGNGSSLERWSGLLLLGPMTAIFLVTEWLLLTGSGSFALVNSLRGAIVAPLLAGIFPALLLVASRRKGELVPGVLYRWLGHPWLVGGIYLLFIISLLLHGSVIWTDLPRRLVALGVGGLLLGMTVWLVRRRVLAPRMVIELRHDQRKGRASGFVAATGGEPLMTTVRLRYGGSEQKLHAAGGTIPTFAALHSVCFQLPANCAGELKVGTYRITPEGETTALTGTLVVHAAEEPQAYDLARSGRASSSYRCVMWCRRSRFGCSIETRQQRSATPGRKTRRDGCDTAQRYYGSPVTDQAGGRLSFAEHNHDPARASAGDSEHRCLLSVQSICNRSIPGLLQARTGRYGKTAPRD